MYVFYMAVHTMFQIQHEIIEKRENLAMDWTFSNIFEYFLIIFCFILIFFLSRWIIWILWLIILHVFISFTVLIVFINLFAVVFSATLPLPLILTSSDSAVLLTVVVFREDEMWVKCWCNGAAAGGFGSVCKHTVYCFYQRRDAVSLMLSYRLTCQVANC